MSHAHNVRCYMLHICFGCLVQNQITIAVTTRGLAAESCQRYARNLCYVGSTAAIRQATWICSCGTRNGARLQRRFPAADSSAGHRVHGRDVVLMILLRIALSAIDVIGVEVRRMGLSIPEGCDETRTGGQDKRWLGSVVGERHVGLRPTISPTHAHRTFAYKSSASLGLFATSFCERLGVCRRCRTLHPTSGNVLLSLLSASVISELYYP
ncbi:hypothetical protein FB567DRAFT_311176 [Paraphoma chrysanthemicola]|uniref:Uncharacterized protein n=1 Tax=Paraphoma chrysanthemicola TaxID=798071 RepID=A0A8K0W0Q6_9PLEO|nr:hypothetical protein FB567DRAFT_311176 [Paraphoma chrysanthemicola]